MITDSIWADSYDVATSQDASGKVSIVWNHYYQQGGWVPVYLIQSSDAGETWSERLSLNPEDNEWEPWEESQVLIDSDGYTHVIWDGGGLANCRILHWTDRVAGDVEGGTTSLIDAFNFNMSDMCGRRIGL